LKQWLLYWKIKGWYIVFIIIYL